MTDDIRPSDLVRDTLPDSPAPAGVPPTSRPSIEDLEEAMRDVVDPELMVNVVDLGLVYDIHLDDDNNCTIDMTLTSPTCPLTDRIEYHRVRHPDGAGGPRRVRDHQLGVAPAVDAGQDHRRRTRAAAVDRVQRLSVDSEA